MKRLMMAAALLLCIQPASSKDLVGKVVLCIDGDTFKLETNVGKVYKVRLSDADAPEYPGQAYGDMSKDTLSHLILDKHVTIKNVKTDCYHRKLGRPYLDDGTDVVAYMIERGYMWFDCKHSKDLELLDLQRNAQKMKFGLWFSGTAIAPWNYRLLSRINDCGLLYHNVP